MKASQLSAVFPIVPKTKPAPAVTSNGTVHPDELFVVRTDDGIILSVHEDRNVVARSAWASYAFEETKEDPSPVLIAEYKLVGIKHYNVGLIEEKKK